MTTAEIIKCNLARGELLCQMNDDALAEVKAHGWRLIRNRSLLRQTRARIAEVDHLIRSNNLLMPLV